jgi:arginyl-tRNA synthetase
VQYAHARIASILRKSVAEGGAPGLAGDPESADEDALASAAAGDAAVRTAAQPTERALVKRLVEFPAEASASADRRAPHRLAAYATAAAADFHAFYRDCQVVGAGEGLEEARLAICVATKRVIAHTLSLLGVSAPARM